jgi:hypothetical protein
MKTIYNKGDTVSFFWDGERTAELENRRPDIEQDWKYVTDDTFEVWEGWTEDDRRVILYRNTSIDESELHLEMIE